MNNASATTDYLFLHTTYVGSSWGQVFSRAPAVSFCGREVLGPNHSSDHMSSLGQAWTSVAFSWALLYLDLVLEVYLIVHATQNNAMHDFL